MTYDPYLDRIAGDSRSRSVRFRAKQRAVRRMTRFLNSAGIRFDLASNDEINTLIRDAIGASDVFGSVDPDSVVRQILDINDRSSRSPDRFDIGRR